jgi:hypothetical protein
MMTGERETMQAIRLAIRQGRLKQPMSGADLNKALGITWDGNFLAKHCLVRAVPRPALCVYPAGSTASRIDTDPRPPSFPLIMFLFENVSPFADIPERHRSLTFSIVADRQLVTLSSYADI